MTKLIFNLTRPAKKGGGERYEHGKEQDNDYMIIYLPQFLSRPEGSPQKIIEVTFE